VPAIEKSAYLKRSDKGICIIDPQKHKGSGIMQILSLGVAEEPKYVYKKLKYLFGAQNNIPGLSIEEKQKGDITFFGIFLSDDEIKKNLDIYSYEKVKYFIAQSICDVILDFTKEKLINRLVEQNYYFLDEIEKQKIVQKAVCKVYEYINDERFSKVKYDIIKKILDYLDNNFELNFEGFLTFRLKNFLKEIANLIDDIANVYFAEREYTEFIKLLKYFLDVQNSKSEIVHILSEKNNYNLHDKDYNLIKDEFFELIKTNLRLNLNKEDILLSRIISLSPAKVLIHKPLNSYFS